MKSFRLGVLLLATAALAACSKVPAGNVGVKVDLYGSSKGVQTEVLSPGRYFIGWNQELYTFPTFTQTYTWGPKGEGNDVDERISFQTTEGLKVTASVGITYHIDSTKANVLFQKYRKGIDEITNIYLHNMVRDAINDVASTVPVDYVYGRGKVQMMQKVETIIRKQVQPYGIEVERVYWVGDMILPDNVTQALNSKIAVIQQSQQRENEVATANAQAQIEVAKATGEANARKIQAGAEADANREIAASISPTLVEYRRVAKWDGHLPTTTGGVIPMMKIGD